MTMETFALAAVILAAIPAILFALNLLVYRPIGFETCPAEPVSVLIPARNEERNIRATVESVLANRGLEFEVIVLDDDSTDSTRDIVRQIAQQDSRLRLLQGPPLPRGWCGKQHACHVLARLAQHPLLVFIDADVRLAPSALSRMARFMRNRNMSLASGVPCQNVQTFSEKLLIPLIHFILLGFLPMHGMRWTRIPGMSGGCGQLFIARRAAYQESGGHSALADSLHDGLKLPRVFRTAGFKTDLFDATDLATCRMYQSNSETWRGLGKNAIEGLAAPGTILPMTLMLFGGQVLPFVLLACASMVSKPVVVCGTIAAALALTPRLVAARRFRQPLASAWVHPIGVLALLLIQWAALTRHWLGRPLQWKGRAYPSAQPLNSAGAQ